MDLPEATGEARAEILDWLNTFSSYVRDVDYASAAPFFHEDVLAFGTHNDVIEGLEHWVSTQWDKVWPRTADFSFVLDAARVLASQDGSLAVAIVPWTSTGFEPHGETFSRPGRATMILQRTVNGWICVHSHMSLNRGVPQESFGERQVKAHYTP